MSVKRGLENVNSSLRGQRTVEIQSFTVPVLHRKIIARLQNHNKKRRRHKIVISRNLPDLKPKYVNLNHEI